MSGAEPGPTTHISPIPPEIGVLALGCWAFGGSSWGGQQDADSLAAMDAALRCGMKHFDTAAGYGRGRSERIVGQFLRGRREQVFLASKASTADMSARTMRALVDASLERLDTDRIDLYYIHWPRGGMDMRPLMEGLEQARQEKKIGAIGVSNFTVEQMEQVSEVGRIDAHQLCYNLLWRFPEREVIPYCREHDIAVVTYSSIAQGILTGKFPRQPRFPEGDQRPKTVLFDREVWPHVYEGVQALNALARESDRTLTHLAIRWVMAQPGVISVLVGARNAAQAEENAAAARGEIVSGVLDQMTRISDQIMSHIPDAGNIFWRVP